MDASALRSWFERVVDADAAARAAALAELESLDPQMHTRLLRLLDQDLRHRASVTRLAHGALAEEPASPPPVPRIGPWRLCEELGRGGMGRVFRAERAEGDVAQEVAIKLVRRDLLDDRLLQRFSTERQLLASLDHPGLCRLIDTGELPDGTPYVVMERVRGEALPAWSRNQRPGLRARIALFLGIADAVAHAHRHLVVHRDLKPGNVMVDEAGRPRLLDFGIAKRLDPDRAAHTLTTDRMFTLAYAAPEQVRGEPVGVACDVYGLGALLYELLCGAAPFPHQGLAGSELERRILERAPPRLADAVPTGERGAALARERGLRTAVDLRRALRGDLEHIVQRCLRKAPQDRYSSVDLLAQDLRRHLDGLPISVRLDDRAYRLRRFLARHRVAASVAGAALMMILAALVYIARQAVDLRAQRDRATAALAVLREAFAAADPVQAAGMDVRARDILDAAGTRLESLRAHRPGLHAELGTSIAQVLLDLGESERAHTLLQSIEATSAAAPDALDPGTRDTLLLLRLRADTDTHRLQEAETRLAQARAADTLPPHLLDLRAAAIEIERGRLDAAIERLTRVRDALADRAPGDRDATEARRRLANALRMARRLPEALAEIDALLAWQRAGLGPDHPMLLPTRISRVMVLGRLDRDEEAISAAETALADVLRIYGERSTLTASAHAALGVALGGARRHVEALAAFERSTAAWSATLGSTHPQTLRARFNLAQAGAVAGADRGRVLDQLESLVHDSDRRDEVLEPLRHFFRINLAEQQLLAGRPEAALTSLVDERGLAGLDAAAEDNRDAHLKLADQAATALGCAAPTRPLPSPCAGLPALDRFRPSTPSSVPVPPN